MIFGKKKRLATWAEVMLSDIRNPWKKFGTSLKNHTMTLSKKLSSILIVSEHLLSNKIFHFIYICIRSSLLIYCNKSVEFRIKLIGNCNFFCKKNISHEISYQLDFVQLMCGVLAVNAYVGVSCKYDISSSFGICRTICRVLTSDNQD